MLHANGAGMTLLRCIGATVIQQRRHDADAEDRADVESARPRHRIHISVSCHMLGIVLLAKGMLHFSDWRGPALPARPRQSVVKQIVAEP